MVIDTSALLSVLFGEAHAPQIEAALEGDPVRLMSAASVLEAAIVVEARLGEAGGRELDLLLHRSKVQVVSFSQEQVEMARYGFRQYGKGRHPAALNFGDCFAYALSRTSGESLLFLGADFRQTDVRQAPLPGTSEPPL